MPAPVDRGDERMGPVASEKTVEVDQPEIGEPAGRSGGEPPTSGGLGRLESLLGPLTGVRLLAIVLAVAFLGGAIGWAVGQRDDQPLSDVDVGFMQDMGVHHLQAVQMSILLLDDETVSQDLKDYALEIIISQRFDQGLFNATLDRFGFPSDPGETVMEWMGGHGVPVDDMSGMASEEQMQQLADATGDDAEALWIALMSEHHLGGMHMADWAARHGSDGPTVALAEAMVQIQRDEILELARYRERAGLPIPDGFTDPRTDQRIKPLSLSGR
jgi:uncharacterized protein (DUF305 family)